MKYDIIQTDSYLIIIDDSEIKEGDLYIDDYNLLRKSITSDKDYWNSRKDYKKIIAHLPLNNSPILEGVDLLPPLKQDDEVEKMAELNGHPESSQFYDYKEGFIDGFLEAKEKYKWTDEDVIKIVEKSRETGLTAEYLMLSLSQPKYPITFELELDALETKDLGNGYSEFVKPLQKRWIGKYIY